MHGMKNTEDELIRVLKKSDFFTVRNSLHEFLLNNQSCYINDYIAKRAKFLRSHGWNDEEYGDACAACWTATTWPTIKQ